MFKNKLNLKTLIAVAICFAGMSAFLSCTKNSISYPYTEYEILHLGNKSGLTSSSSDQAFEKGLNEVLQAWSANNPSSDDMIFDGITYELTNLQEATGAVPNYIWDIFWEKLSEYSYSIGSCWIFTEVKIPSKGGVGTGYVLYTIVKEEDRGYGGLVRYIAIKCNIGPKASTKNNAKTDSVEKFNELIKSVKFEDKSIGGTN